MQNDVAAVLSGGQVEFTICHGETVPLPIKKTKE